MNKVILCGRTCMDWKTHKYGDGKTFLTNTVAVSDFGEKTEFVNVTVFGKTGEVVYKYVKKGDMVLLEGSIHNSSGEKKFTYVLVSRAELLPNARKGNGEKSEGNRENGEEDIQF